MTDTRVLPYGSWPSPLSAADVARGGVRLSFVALHGGTAWWDEGRASEGGRTVVVRQGPDGTARDVVPASWNVRTRVHEYGGRAWLPVTWEGRTHLVAARWDDQRLHLLDVDGGAEPRPLTPEPDAPAALRYVEPVLGPSGDEVWCVREAHTDVGIARHVVAVPLDGRGATDPGAVRALAGGSDFLACPRPSPDGRHLAWLAWDHPRMPWDGSELRVAEIRDDGSCGPARTPLGGEHESVAQVEWADDATLYAASDRSGFWNLYALGLDGGAPRPLCPRGEEFGLPLWQPGFTSYALLGDGRVLAAHGTAVSRLGVLDPATGTLTDLDLGFDSRGPAVAASGSTVLTVTGGATRPDTVLRFDVPPTGTSATTPATEALRTSPDPLPDAAYLPETREATVTGPGGREVHALVSPPRNPEATGPEDARPPYVVFVHGGPTAHVQPRVDLTKAYFTSRGVGVVDVNYGGSSGYGREYRERLREQWGVVDVEDCVAAARALVDQGDADGERLAIRGGSAGGWTTLAALTRTDAFDAGASYFGVAELLRFADDTHDFESRYLDGLVGPLPEARDRYVERAPLSHVDGVSCPVLLLQGLEDEVVPPSQSEMFADALDRKGIPYAYLAFEGEQHGFRREETQVAALEAELSFYGQVFGFATPGVPTLPLRHAEALPGAAVR